MPYTIEIADDEQPRAIDRARLKRAVRGVLQEAGIESAEVSVAIVTVLFALIYKYMPRVRISWHDVWIGAGVTALLFTVGKFVIGLYLGNASVGRAYGGAGSVVVLLVWVYYSAQIVFLGAEYTYAYHKVRGSRVLPEDYAAPVTAEAHAVQGIPEPEQVKATVEYLKHEDPTHDDNLQKS